MLSRHHRSGLRSRLPVAIGIAALALTGCSSDDTTASNPFVTTERPTDLVIESAGPAGVFLRWVHDDTDETGFTVARRVGNAAQFQTLAELPADTERYTDRSPDPSQPMVYSVSALYDGASASVETPATVELDLLPPTQPPSANLVDTGIRVTWLPPDFEQFDGFQLLRLIDRAGHSLIDTTVQIDHDNSLPVAWDDTRLPAGLIGDRMAYQVATRRLSRLSPPLASNPFQWSLPTGPVLTAGGLAHLDASGRFVASQDAALLALERPDGTAHLDVIDVDVQDLQSRYLYRHDEADGTLAGALPMAGIVVVAHLPADSSTVTFHGIAIDDEVEIWSLESTAPVAFVTEGPTQGTALYADGSTFVTVDGSSGAEIARTPVDETAALAHVVGGDRLVVVETRAPTFAAEARLALRAYPSGTLVWSTAWLTGDLLSGDKSLEMSADGRTVALNVTTSTGERTLVVRTADGAGVGEVEGRTVGFTLDGMRALVLESVPGTPRAYRLALGLEAEDLFGTDDLTASFLDTSRNRLWAFDTGGSIRVYVLELGWGHVLEGRATARPRDGEATIDLDAGVPRFELTGP